jgi:hypothetical protein
LNHYLVKGQFQAGSLTGRTSLYKLQESLVNEGDRPSTLRTYLQLIDTG